MRAILLDWLMQVQYTIKLLPATLWLTVGILDRYLAISPHLKRDNLQLVGATALLLASKIEEHRAPALKCFVEWTEGVCQKKDIQQMEFTIMQALDYQLIVTTAHNFLRLYLHRIQATKRISYVAYYLAERMLLDASYFSYTAAVYAAGAVYAARFTAMYESGIQHVVWTEELVLESQLTAAEVLPCAAQMLRCARTPISPAKRRLLDTVHKKYATRQTQHVSEIDFPTLD
ncbi:hypothetical protein EON65_20215 [archaeon]|nr:MAG: hypothetical protein EON65_20215 [archaeon]